MGPSLWWELTRYYWPNTTSWPNCLPVYQGQKNWHENRSELTRRFCSFNPLAAGGEKVSQHEKTNILILLSIGFDPIVPSLKIFSDRSRKRSQCLFCLSSSFPHDDKKFSARPEIMEPAEPRGVDFHGTMSYVYFWSKEGYWSMFATPVQSFRGLLSFLVAY